MKTLLLGFTTVVVFGVSLMQSTIKLHNGKNKIPNTIGYITQSG
jgi:hypothetical protein